ncbi:MAG: Crp/Fnr family transcriptional regulator [Nitrospira sp.]|nr:Crp/Fnr family transcriptional regulator [Nitrospira sp.]
MHSDQELTRVVDLPQPQARQAEPVHLLASHGLITRYPAGQFIVHQGAPNTGIHMICDGLVLLSTSASHQGESFLYILGTGGIVGLADHFLDQRRHHMSARSLTDCTLSFIPKTDVTTQMNSQSLDASSLLIEMSRALRMLERRFVLRDSAQASDRLVAALLWLSDLDNSQVIPFPLDRSMLSILIGVQPETVSRLMSRLQASRLLSYSRGRIIISDREKLQRLLTIQIDSILPPDESARTLPIS